MSNFLCVFYLFSAPRQQNTNRRRASKWRDGNQQWKEERTSAEKTKKRRKKGRKKAERRRCGAVCCWAEGWRWTRGWQAGWRSGHAHRHLLARCGCWRGHGAWPAGTWHTDNAVAILRYTLRLYRTPHTPALMIK